MRCGRSSRWQMFAACDLDWAAKKNNTRGLLTTAPKKNHSLRLLTSAQKHIAETARWKTRRRSVFSIGNETVYAACLEQISKQAGGDCFDNRRIYCKLSSDSELIS